MSNAFPEPPIQRDFLSDLNGREVVDPIWAKWFFDLTQFLRGLPPLGSVAGHTIEDEGVVLTQRADLNFVGAGVTAADSGGKTVVTIPGGSDPWTYIELAADFSTGSLAPVAVPGLAFTPAANQTYVVEAFLLIQSSDVVVGVKPGVSWPTGLSDGAARIDSTNGGTAIVLRNANFSTDESAPGTDMPLANASYPATMTATMLSGAGPAGNFQLTLARE